MFPVIQNPSKVTDTCATLIDNFYVNVLEYKISSGLLINDTSDHLPIFAVLDKLKVCRKKQNSRKYIRTTTDSNEMISFACYVCACANSVFCPRVC